MPRAPELPPTSLAIAFAKPAPAGLSERMQSWAAKAAGRLGALGLRVAPSPVVEAGSLRTLSFDDARDLPIRDGELRLGEREGRGSGPEPGKRARLALSITPVHIEVALQVPPNALDGLRWHLATPERSLELITALESLPEQFTVGLAERAEAQAGKERARVPASSVASDEIRGLLEGAVREPATIWLGWVVPRALAIAHADLLDEQLEDALVALACVFAMVASRPAERPPLVRPAAAAERERRERAGAEDDGGRRAMRRVARRRDHDRDRERVRDGVRDRGLERGLAIEAARADRDVGSPPFPALSTIAAIRAGAPRRAVMASLAARVPLRKGARVRVLDGPFTGKTGVVQDIDGKGGARVMLGLLAIRLDVKDLARCVDGRDRPVLSSSHRKRLPARS